MYKVGFVDDDSDAFEDYKIRLKRKDIDLNYLDEWNELSEIVDWILANSVECLIVDYKLTPKYSYHGTKVVAFVNGHLPDLPCIILTNYPEDSSEENLVVNRLILDRNRMANDDISEVCDIIKQSTLVYRNRLKIHLTEYKELLDKRKRNLTTLDDEEDFLHLYRLLRSYGEVDDIPSSLLKSDVNERVDSLLNKIDLLIDFKKE